ncbi:intracellular protein transport protein USO1-like [Arachis ipaensis]|uniref:intracellular protein transport protein USO1-like n=1 Tax=Arachis ipaensis TaxID=130454 RepID=UPI000A2B65C3|nr:intracellular protein transport protein USO1-like [Arachis ipaensis]
MVGEIDTKPIEPVQNAISLFGDNKADPNKSQSARIHKVSIALSPTTTNLLLVQSQNFNDLIVTLLLFSLYVCEQLTCEKEIEDLRKELANLKVQLEAKHAAHMQALLKLEHNQKKIHELSTLLKKCDLERKKNMNDDPTTKHETETESSKMKEMAELSSLEAAKLRDQLSHVLSELKATQRELLNKETELVAARDFKLKAIADAEEMRNALEIEKEQKEEIMKQVKELSEVIHSSKLDDAIEAERENFAAVLSEKDERIALAEQELEDMRNQIEQNERKIMDQSTQIGIMEIYMNQLKEEAISAKEEINGLNNAIESVTGELQKAKIELNMYKERDIESQVEIALLKSQFQEHRLAYIHQEHENQDWQGELNMITRIGSGSEEVRMNMENKNGEIAVVAAGAELPCELASMKKELRMAAAKMAELRGRAEQALSRAEVAEKAKAALEDKIARHREHRQRRKAALTALKEESNPKQFSPSSPDSTLTLQQPLGKVLNLKV